MLPAMGASIEVGGLRVSVDGPSTLSGVRFEVPGDFSSAAFFLVAALLAPDSEVILESVGVNPTRVGLLNVLKRMGAKIDVVSERMEAGEPVADIIASSSLLSGTVVAADEIPSLVDEIPILAVAASVANGDTWIQGAGELRVKETDRLAAVCSQLRLMGAQIEETTDGLKVYGPSRLCGTHLTSFGDHRMAMSLAIAGLIADGETVIGDFECVATSFPDFEKHLRRLSGLWQ
jgi:3-phosphoshikimate 1-carboxyvinyltransferase